MNKTFWRDALLTGLTLAGLLGLQGSAMALSEMPHGRFSAMLVKLTASRAILFNAGVTGYYERILKNGTTRDVDLLRHDDYVYDPFRIFRLRPDSTTMGVPTNSFGFVGREWSVKKPPDTRRVALLGDSITEGFGVSPDQTFGALLEDRLNATHPRGTSERFEVMSFAVPAYNLTQLLDVAEKDASRFDPDIYVLDLTEISVFRLWDLHLVDMIALGIDPKYDFLRATVRNAGASMKDDDATLHAKLAPYRIATVRETLLELKSNAERHHAQFVVMLVPTLEDADLTKKRFAGIPELLDSLDITTVNLLDTFDHASDIASLRDTRWDVHPNAQGHAMIAANLYTKLRAQPNAWSALVGNASGGH
jgi:lysophospholipase L1-like esterase